jgi:hypothetical protein
MRVVSKCADAICDDEDGRSREEGQDHMAEPVLAPIQLCSPSCSTASVDFLPRTLSTSSFAIRLLASTALPRRDPCCGLSFGPLWHYHPAMARYGRADR